MTTNKTTQKRRPDFHAFHVPDRKNAFWTRIGAVWAHEDGEGYTLQLELMPMDGSRIVLRKPGAGENGEPGKGEEA